MNAPSSAFQPRGKPPLVLAVAGYSGTGKTSLLERVVPRLVERGIRIGYLKANAHRVDLDREGKDTDRLRSAGAEAVAIDGDGGTVVFPPRLAPISRAEGFPVSSHPASEGTSESASGSRRERPLKRAPYESVSPLGAHLVRIALWSLGPVFRNLDLVLAEGLKSSQYPKIVINREDSPRGRLDPRELENVIFQIELPSLPQDTKEWDPYVEQLVSLLCERLGAEPRRRSGEYIGAVLAGGTSERLGRDKASLPIGDSEAAGTWMERALLLLAERFEDVWVIGRTLHTGDLAAPRLAGAIPSHLDLRPGCGPLGGLETALQVGDGRGVMAIPCDLPLLELPAIDSLLARDPAGESSLAYGFRHSNGRREPAVVLLEPSALDPLTRFLDGGGRKLGQFLDEVGTRWIEIPESLRHAFTNVNTKEDWDRYRAGMGF